MSAPWMIAMSGLGIGLCLDIYVHRRFFMGEHWVPIFSIVGGVFGLIGATLCVLHA